MGTFIINGARLEMIKIVDTNAVLQIKSVPRPYYVEFNSGPGVSGRLSLEISQQPAPLILADKWIFEKYLSPESSLREIPTCQVGAS